MRIIRLAAPLTVTVLGAGACDDGVSPSVDTPMVLPDGGIEPTAPFGSDPQMTPAPNPNAGAGGAAPTPTGVTSPP